MALWTFINEYKGGTFIAQYKAEKLQFAFEKYIQLEFPKVLKIAKSKPTDIEIDLNHDYPVKVDGAKSTYCITLSGKNSLIGKPQNMLINIVRTAED